MVYRTAEARICLGSAAQVVERLFDGKLDVSNVLRFLDDEETPKFDERSGELQPQETKSSPALYCCLTAVSLHNAVVRHWRSLRDELAQIFRALVNGEWAVLPLVCELLIHQADRVAQASRALDIAASKLGGLKPRDVNRPQLNNSLSRLAGSLGVVVKEQLNTMVDITKSRFNEGVTLGTWPHQMLRLQRI